MDDLLQWPVFIYCIVSTCVWYGSDSRIRYRSDLIVFLLLLLNVMVCDLYFAGHILLCLCITLILIIYIVCIVYMWESIMNIPSLPTSHFSSCCCESTLSLCTPISIPLICYWINTSNCSCCLSLWLWSIGSWYTWHSRHTYHLVVCLLYKELHHTALGYSLG